MPKKQKISDKELIIRIKEKSDDRAYAMLLERYEKSTMSIILKLINNRSDAEDLTILSFTKAFKNIESYDENFAFSTWLFKIATNSSIDFLRKKRIQTTPIDGLRMDEDNSSFVSRNIMDTGLNPEVLYVLEQRKEIMNEVVESLSPIYRELIKLRFFQELKYDEIAERLNIPIGTVKARLSRAKNLLTEILLEHKDKF